MEEDYAGKKNDELGSTGGEEEGQAKAMSK